LCGGRDMVRRTETGRFMIQLPRTSANPLCSFYMQSGW
jgi:hypothetical protein